MAPDEANDALRLLKDRLATIGDVQGIESLHLWDQPTYMPAGGVAGRAGQLATLRRLAHELLVSEETGRLLDSVIGPEPGSEDFSLLRRARREYGRAAKLPVGRGARARNGPGGTGLAEGTGRLRLGTLAPHLEKIHRGPPVRGLWAHDAEGARGRGE